jgi:hypothetical protein
MRFVFSNDGNYRLKVACEIRNSIAPMSNPFPCGILKSAQSQIQIPTGPFPCLVNASPGVTNARHNCKLRLTFRKYTGSPSCKLRLTSLLRQVLCITEVIFPGFFQWRKFEDCG